jgi:hypothetical protein
MQSGLCKPKRFKQAQLFLRPQCEYRKGVDYKGEIMYYRDIESGSECIPRDVPRGKRVHG